MTNEYMPLLALLVIIFHFFGELGAKLPSKTLYFDPKVPDVHKRLDPETLFSQMLFRGSSSSSSHTYILHLFQVVVVFPQTGEVAFSLVVSGVEGRDAGNTGDRKHARS